MKGLVGTEILEVTHRITNKDYIKVKYLEPGGGGAGL